ncbi:MAG TPA: STAS domain-containing protein [Kofleriaceae bacterium]|nr:STAS domain-containing protein [Kofleriaceae bacterium]
MREIVLPRSLDITVVRTVAADLLDALAGGELMLDASLVGKLDAAGLQLLCATVVTARASGARVEWKGVSPTLEAGAHTLALADTLGWSRARTQENR